MTYRPLSIVWVDVREVSELILVDTKQHLMVGERQHWLFTGEVVLVKVVCVKLAFLYIVKIWSINGSGVNPTIKCISMVKVVILMVV